MATVQAPPALEPFVLLSKSATASRAAADLVTQATTAPNTFVFGELLATPNISKLASDPDYVKYLDLLKIFAWGTWADYKKHTNLPQLSNAQEEKLKLLSLIPLAQTPSSLSYGKLTSALDLADVRELEDLVIKAMYADLVRGKLNPAQQRVELTALASRDIAPGAVSSISAQLDAWNQRCHEAQTDLEQQIEQIREAVRLRILNNKAHADAVNRAQAKLPALGPVIATRRGDDRSRLISGKKAGKRMIPDDDEDLGVDDEDEGDEMEVDADNASRRAKKGAFRVPRRAV